MVLKRLPPKRTQTPEFTDVAEQLIILELDIRQAAKEERHLRELENRRRAEAWDFLLCRGIRVSSSTDLDKPAEKLRKMFKKFRFSIISVSKRLQSLLQATKVIQRFFRKARRIYHQRIHRILMYWCKKEVAIRDVMRARIQQYQKTHPYQHVVTNNVPLWRDYLQCRVPRSLKVKTIKDALGRRKQQWHKEWTTYQTMQAKVRVLIDKERAILAASDFQNSPEIEQIRAQRKLIGRIPEPVLRTDVASFPLMELLVRALEIEDIDLREAGHSYFAPGNSGEEIPREQVPIEDGGDGKGGRRMSNAKAWQGAFKESKRCTEATKDVDWQRPQHGLNIPFAHSPPKKHELELQDRGLRTLGETTAIPSKVHGSEMQRATPYYYASGKIKARRHVSADAAVVPREKIQATGEKNDGTPGLYTTERSLKDELDVKSKREVPFAWRRRNKMVEDSRKRWVRGGHVGFNDTVQTFITETSCIIERSGQAGNTSLPLEADEDAPLPTGETFNCINRCSAPEASVAAPCKGPRRRRVQVTFKPLQHPGPSSEVHLTPRLSCSPSSPTYCPPGAGPVKTSHFAQAIREKPKNATSLDTLLSDDSCTEVENPNGNSFISAAATTPLTVDDLGFQAGDFAKASVAAQLRLQEGRSPRICNAEGVESMCQSGLKGGRPVNAGFSKTDRSSLALWKPSSEAAMTVPAGGSAMAGIAQLTGLLNKQHPHRTLIRMTSTSCYGPSQAASLLADVASRQAEVLKQLDSDPAAHLGS